MIQPGTLVEDPFDYFGTVGRLREKYVGPNIQQMPLPLHFGKEHREPDKVVSVLKDLLSGWTCWDVVTKGVTNMMFLIIRGVPKEGDGVMYNKQLWMVKRLDLTTQSVHLTRPCGYGSI